MLFTIMWTVSFCLAIYCLYKAAYARGRADLFKELHEANQDETQSSLRVIWWPSRREEDS